MQVTKVRIHLVNEERLKAFAECSFDNCFLVKNIRIVDVNGRMLISMPSRKKKDDTYEDLAHPLTHEFRAQMDSAIMDAYKKEIDELALTVKQ